jgi:hypothetical protein
MTEKKDPNKKHYFAVASNEELAEFYKVTEYFPHPKILKLKPTGKLMTKITGSTKNGKQVLIKVPIEDKINYFTGGRLKFHPEDLSYSLEIQQEIYKSQARGNFRLSASDVIPLQFKIDEQVFDAVDISVSGTSIIVSSAELERFSKGKLFQESTLRFDRKNYHIPLSQIAVHIAQLDADGKPNDLFKIGIAFKDLPRKTEDELYIKISTEARGEEMKKKFDTILTKKNG